MYPLQVDINQDNIDRLTRLFKGAYKDIIDEIEGATSFGIARRRALLKQIEGILKSLGVDVYDFVKQEIPTYYKSGADDAVKQLEHVNAPLRVDEGFSLIHKQAITALVDETSSAFGESLSGVNRSAQRVITTAVREQITQQLAYGSIKGSALRNVQSAIVGTLRSEGLQALIDKAGNAWSLDRYAEMLIRTKAVEARNRGLANRMVENGYDLVQVSQHGSTHPACRVWEGKVLSLTGATTEFNGEQVFTIQQAKDKGLFHPNCKHAINVLIPELAALTYQYDSTTGTYKKGLNGSPPTPSTPPTTVTIGSFNFPLNQFESTLASEKGLLYDASASRTSYGQYNSGTKTISINPKELKKATARSERTFYHEFGHFIDYEHGTTRYTAGNTQVISALRSDGKSIVLDRLSTALEEHNLTDDQIWSLVQGGTVKLDETRTLRLPKSYRSYVTSSKEVFADAYAQFKIQPALFKKYAPSTYQFFKQLK